MQRWATRVWLGSLLLGLCGTGCGPIVSTQWLSRANSAMAQAEAVQAQTWAVYEYVSAEEYLRKAREEWGYGQWQQAARYARLASEQARAAATRIRERTDALGQPVRPEGTSAQPAPGGLAPPARRPAGAVPASGNDPFRPVPTGGARPAGQP